MNQFGNKIIENILNMLGGFSTDVDKAAAILTTDIFTGEKLRIATEVSNVIKPMGLTIAGICFMIAFLNAATQMDMLKFETVLKLGFKLALAKGAMDISFEALSAIYSLSAEWIIGIRDISGVGGEFTTAVLEAAESSFADASVWEMIAVFASTFIVTLAIKLCGVLILVISYARMFELLVYVSASPIPFAFLPLEDGRGGRMVAKFLASFAGVCLQGLFILISFSLFEVICADVLLDQITTGDGDYMQVAFTMLVGTITLTLAVTKSGAWAKAIFEGI